MGPLLGGAGESTRVHGQHCPPLSDICDHNGHHWDENLPLCIAASYRSALYRPLCCAPTTCLLCCVLRLFCCLVLPLRVPCTPFCAPCVGVFRFYVHCCVLCYALLCCLLRASCVLCCCVLCCCVLPLRASCLARGPVLCRPGDTSRVIQPPLTL